MVVVRFEPAPASASGPSGLTWMVPYDDIVIIETNSESTDKDIMVHFSHPSPNTVIVPYSQQKKELDMGQTAGVKAIKLEL